MTNRNRLIIAFRTLFILAFAFTSYCAFVKPGETPVGVVFIINDKVLHASAFFVLSWLLDYSFPQRTPHLLKPLFLFGYGIAIEWIQYYLPWRESSLTDLLADSAGLGLYALAHTRLKTHSWLARINTTLFSGQSDARTG